VSAPAAPRKLEPLQQRSPLGAWEYVFADPAPALAGIVRRYCGYRERTPGPLRRRELPGAQLVVIVDLGPTLSVLDRDRPERRDRFAGGFAAGLDDGHTITETAGAMSGVQVDLTALGGRLLLGGQAAALAGRVAGLAELEGPFPVLAERLGNLDTWEERFAALDRLLLDAAGHAAPVPGWIRWAAERLEAAGGRAPVLDLARQVGVSRKHLAATFRAELGMTPKRFARLVRFDRLLRHLRTGRDGRDWTIAALDHGYYDQAHFVREFRAFTGLTPGELRRRTRPELGVIEPR
jgi:AraC-like DNA-binding protein